MRRRELLAFLAGAAALRPLSCVAQPETARRIAVPLLRAAASSPAVARRLAALRNGLAERGYVEGMNLAIDQRDAGGSAAAMAGLCRDMIAKGAEVIVAVATPAALVAQKATSAVPIVMRAGADPVAAGLVASLARPGGNITGVTSEAADLSAKRLQILQELVPGLRRVAVLWEPPATASQQSMRQTEMAARPLGIDIAPVGVRGADDFTAAFQTITTGRFAAVDVLASPLVTLNRGRILDFVREAGIAAMYQERPFVEAGGLLSYGPDFEQLFRRLAYFVDRILKGAKPADLPVEEPTTFELVVNLKTAKALGLTIPHSFLQRADEVIE